jgi:hypothetical protein
MNQLSNQTQTELATKMVLLDAIQKGHTSKKDLCMYMESQVFAQAVKNYKSMLAQL